MKRLTVALTALVFALTAILINPISSSAVGVDTAVKLVGGKAVVRAVAEKTGLALSPKQLDNVVDLIEKKTYDGDTEVIEWANKANLVKSNPSTTPSTKTGFKKYVLDPMLWLTGADLILEAVDAFQDGYEGNTEVELYKQCIDTTGYPSFTGWSAEFNHSNGAKYLYVISSPVSPQVKYGYDGTPLIVGTSSFSYTTYAFNGTSWANQGTGSSMSRTSVFGAGFENAIQLSLSHTLKGTNDELVCKKVPTVADVIDVSNVDSSVKQSFDNDTYNTNTTYNLEIEMPDVENYNDVTPWNEKDIEIENEVVVAPPVVIDPDEDGDEVIGAVLVKGDPIETPSNFFTLMGSMGAKMHDMYNGVIKFFSDSVDGMEKMLVGSAGLVTFMTGYFDIFPDEFTNVLMVAVMLGFIMHFFRR